MTSIHDHAHLCSRVGVTPDRIIGMWFEGERIRFEIMSIDPVGDGGYVRNTPDGPRIATYQFTTPIG